MPQPVSVTVSRTKGPAVEPGCLRARLSSRSIVVVSILSRAARWHGVTGVDDQVHGQLLDLPGIRVDVSGIGRHADNELDSLADDAAQQPLDAGNTLVEIDFHRLHYVLSTEDEQLPGQRPRDAGGTLDFSDVLARRAVGRQIVADQCRVPDDGGQQSVEVVGDSACESPNGFHFLGLPELIFELLTP